MDTRGRKRSKRVEDRRHLPSTRKVTPGYVETFYDFDGTPLPVLEASKFYDRQQDKWADSDPLAALGVSVPPLGQMPNASRLAANAQTKSKMGAYSPNPLNALPDYSTLRSQMGQPTQFRVTPGAEPRANGDFSLKGSGGDETLRGAGTGDYQFNGEIANRLISDMQRDFDLTREQAVGFVGGLAMESHGFDDLQEWGKGKGEGYGMWTGKRRDNFRSFAENNGLDTTSYEANYGFIKDEVLNRPRDNGGILRRLKATETPEEAVEVVTNHYLRPGTPRMSQRKAWTAAINQLETTPVPPEEIVETAAVEPEGPANAFGYEPEAVTLGYSTSGVRRAKIKPELATQLQTAVLAVYGPGYGIDIMSAAQPEGPKGTKGTTGTRRHGTSVAADVWITDPSGKRLVGADLIPLGQHWLGKDIGSVGFPVTGSNSMHLDLIGGSVPGSVPLGRKEGKYWFYGSPSPSMRAALTSGELPTYAVPPEEAAGFFAPRPADLPASIAAARGLPINPQASPALDAITQVTEQIAAPPGFTVPPRLGLSIAGMPTLGPGNGPGPVAMPTLGPGTGPGPVTMPTLPPKSPMTILGNGGTNSIGGGIIDRLRERANRIAVPRRDPRTFIKGNDSGDVGGGTILDRLSSGVGARPALRELASERRLQRDTEARSPSTTRAPAESPSRIDLAQQLRRVAENYVPTSQRVVPEFPGRLDPALLADDLPTSFTLTRDPPVEVRTAQRTPGAGSETFRPVRPEALAIPINNQLTTRATDIGPSQRIVADDDELETALRTRAERVKNMQAPLSTGTVTPDLYSPDTSTAASGFQRVEDDLERTLQRRAEKAKEFKNVPGAKAPQSQAALVGEIIGSQARAPGEKITGGKGQNTLGGKIKPADVPWDQQGLAAQSIIDNAQAVIDAAAPAAPNQDLKVLTRNMRGTRTPKPAKLKPKPIVVPTQTGYAGLPASELGVAPRGTDELLEQVFSPGSQTVGRINSGQAPFLRGLLRLFGGGPQGNSIAGNPAASGLLQSLFPVLGGLMAQNNLDTAARNGIRTLPVASEGRRLGERRDLYDHYVSMGMAPPGGWGGNRYQAADGTRRIDIPDSRSVGGWTNMSDSRRERDERRQRRNS